MKRLEIGWRHTSDERFHKIALEDPDSTGWFAADLPQGPIELLVRASHLGSRPAIISGIELGEGGAKGEVELERGLVASFVLDPESDALPEGVSILLLEVEGADDVRVFRSRIDILDGGNLYPGLSCKQTALYFDDTTGAATVTGLAPGRYRFRVLRGGFEFVPPEVFLAGDVIEAISVLCQSR
jgi:hypothetical protein